MTWRRGGEEARDARRVERGESAPPAARARRSGIETRSSRRRASRTQFSFVARPSSRVLRLRAKNRRLPLLLGTGGWIFCRFGSRKSDDGPITYIFKKARMGIVPRGQRRVGNPRPASSSADSARRSVRGSEAAARHRAPRRAHAGEAGTRARGNVRMTMQSAPRALGRSPPSLPGRAGARARGRAATRRGWRKPIDSDPGSARRFAAVGGLVARGAPRFSRPPRTRGSIGSSSRPRADRARANTGGAP